MSGTVLDAIMILWYIAGAAYIAGAWTAAKQTPRDGCNRSGARGKVYEN